MRISHLTAIVAAGLLGACYTPDKPINPSPSINSDAGGPVVPSAPTSNSTPPNTGVGMDAGSSTTPPSAPHCGDVGQLKCALGENCRTSGDCNSEVCNYKGVCIATEQKSCAAHFGGDTCGLGEVDDPAAQHESCCATDTLPSGTVLDRYILTQGRVRQVVEATGGNFQAWYDAHKATLDPIAVSQIDPYRDHLSTQMIGDDYSIVAQFFGAIYVPDMPSDEQGCQIAGNGTHYWFTPEQNAYYGDVPNVFPQEVMDTKPMNCTTSYMAALVCAYDGKHLQSIDDANDAFGATQSSHPWDIAGGWGSVNGVYVVIGPSNKGGFGAADGACPSCSTSLINWANNYTYPNQDPAHPYDYAFYVSAPGRFPIDTGPYGTKDVAGDVLVWTGSPANWLDKDGRTTTYLALNGSWESHYTVSPALDNYYAFNAEVKYGKIGARCAK
jgi:hypothetical protein